MAEGHDERDYEVGYGKPPKDHQFKTGHQKSRGKRRKKRQSLQEIVEEILFEPVGVIRKGKSVKVPTIKAMLLKQRAAALQGNERATAAMMAIAQKHLPQAPEQEGEDEALNEAEQAVLSDVLAMKQLFEGGDHD